MVPFLYGPREHHRVTTPEAYRAKHRAWFKDPRRGGGGRFAVHVVPTPAPAYVSANTWVIDCECGAGNAVDRMWDFACCFGCGAVHTRLVFPPDAAAIEQVLLARPHVKTRHWQPGESIGSLVGENVAHGVEAGR